MKQSLSMKEFIPGFLVLLMISSINACEDTGSVGSDLLDDPVQLITIDTLSVKASTVFMDSVDTQGSGELLAGSYTDEYLGQVSAKAYLKLSLGNTFSVSQNAEYDSLTLKMDVNYHYGEAAQSQKINVHRVLEYIEPTGDNTRLYSFNGFAYDPNILGQTSLIPEDEDSVEITISDAIGLHLFQAFQNEDDLVSNIEEFREYLKGLVLVDSDATNTAITGFDADSTDNIVLRLYYTDLGSGISEQQYYDFPLAADSSFSQITGNHPAPLNRLTKSKDEISGVEAGNRVFIQSGVGLMTRLEFPTIDNLFDLTSIFDVIGVELYLFPVAQTYEAETPLPDPVTMYLADSQNRILAQFPDDQGNGLTATPTTDYEYNKYTYYSFNVTNYFMDELNTDRYTGRGLLVAPASSLYEGSVDRIILGDGNNPEFNMYLRIYLSEFNY